jgi:3-isopropylmalate dehydrogenase
MVLSAAMLLAWLGGERKDEALGDAGRAIERAVAATLAHGPRTRDLGGTASTAEFTTAVVQRISDH